MVEGGGVAVHHFDLAHGVERQIVARVAHTPLVKIDGHAVFRPAQGGENRQNARSATHVEDFEPAHLVVEQTLQHLCGGLVVPRAERHLRIDLNGVGRGGNVGVEGGRHHAARIFGRADEQRLEVIFLPLLVPVFVLHLFAHIVDMHVGQGEVGQHRAQLRFVKTGGGNVGLEGIGVGLVGKHGALGEVVSESHARQV